MDGGRAWNTNQIEIMNMGRGRDGELNKLDITTTQIERINKQIERERDWNGDTSPGMCKDKCSGDYPTELPRLECVMQG